MPDDSGKSRKRALHLPTSKGRIDADLRDEFRFHMEERVEQFMAAGMTREEAESEVHRRFGDVRTWHQMAREIDEETMRQDRRFELFDTIRRETGRSIRVLLKTPAFSLMSLLTLALGIGATTAIYTVLDSAAALSELERAGIHPAPGDRAGKR